MTARSRPTRSAVVTAAVALAFGLAVAPAALAAPSPSTAPGCLAADASLTPEEQRLEGPVPQEILVRSGFDAYGPLLVRDLCGASSLSDARQVVRTHGRALWDAAVDRAQGRGRAGGDLSRDDDRPLYWARLAMTTAVRRWSPAFGVGDEERADLLRLLERASRGQDAVRFPPGEGVTRILVSGFDPFLLDDDIRRSNPSGAAALALDGALVRTAAGPARIETAMFPVRWRDFEDGMVERTFLPHLQQGPRAVDMFATVSQGRPGRFDVERFNGAWHAWIDNERAERASMIPIPDGVPTVEPQPQWTTTTLPYAEIVAAETGRFPVYDNTRVTEIPQGGTEPVVRPDGPTPGSTARSGGGGSYLSNEIAYRATLLRDAVGAQVPGGHVHTPVLTFAEGNTTEVTDPVFVRNRLDIIDQVRRIVAVAAGTLRG